MVHDLYLNSMEGPWLVDRLWEAHVTFFLLHNKLLQVAIWLGPWIVSLLRVLTTWQTLVCWSVIYLCEAVAQGVRSFGSTRTYNALRGLVQGSLQSWKNSSSNFYRFYFEVFIFVSYTSFPSVPFSYKLHFYTKLFCNSLEIWLLVYII